MRKQWNTDYEVSDWFQEIIPDHQDSPARDPLGSSNSIGAEHPSMADYLEFMKDIPKRHVEG